MKPSDEQVKEFWVGLGFTNKSMPFGLAGRTYETQNWVSLDNSYIGYDLPPIDLNSLFKYAVPKLVNEGYVVRVSGEPNFPTDLYPHGNPAKKACLGEVFGYYHMWDDDPALALFWACYKAIKSDKLS